MIYRQVADRKVCDICTERWLIDRLVIYIYKQVADRQVGDIYTNRWLIDRMA